MGVVCSSGNNIIENKSEEIIDNGYKYNSNPIEIPDSPIRVGTSGVKKLRLLRINSENKNM